MIWNLLQEKSKRNLEISYKPQYPQVDHPGTVRGYLSSKLSDLGQGFKVEVLEPLGVDELLENDIQNLSGGELQRTVIAACLGQPADLYLLDEPSAYLDVEQRLEMARTLRKFIESRKFRSFCSRSRCSCH